MMDVNIIEAAAAYAIELFAGDSGGHDADHTMRVTRLALRLAKEEGADPATVQLAALLHDTDDIKLSPDTHASKGNAVRFLKEHGATDEETERICRIISQVSFEGTGSSVPDSIEGKCVQDADRLDALGAIGIARTFAYGGSRGRKIYDPDEEPLLNMDSRTYHSRSSCSVNHFYEKLFLLKDMMNTASARKLAEEREFFMKEYLDRFLLEWEGLD